MKGASDVQQTVSHMPMTMLIGSCAKVYPPLVVADTACSWVRIIYLTDHDIDVLISRPSATFWYNKAAQINCAKYMNDKSAN